MTRHGPSKARTTFVLAATARGMSQSEIARKLGVSAATVRRELGLKDNGQRVYGRRAGKLVTAPMDQAAHGKPSGRRAHQRRGEPPCAACSAARYGKE